MINKEDANILIVDDIEDNRYTLERRLKRDGYKNIFSAEGGKVALDMASKNRFDLILLDLMMPDMSGLEVLKHLKGDPLQRTIPVIMVTASDEVETAAECIINGADDFITKPFNGTLLKARVGASLEKKRLRDSEENYLDRVVKPAARSATRSVVGRYTPEQIYSSKRDVIQEEIYLETKKILDKQYVQLNEVLVRDVTLPTTIKEAIERKLKQEQESLEYEFRLQKATKEAEKQKIEAEGKAAANRILNASLTDKILKEKGIQATLELAKSPNAKTVVIGSGKSGLPLILNQN